MDNLPNGSTLHCAQVGVIRVFVYGGSRNGYVNRSVPVTQPERTLMPTTYRFEVYATDRDFNEIPESKFFIPCATDDLSDPDVIRVMTAVANKYAGKDVWSGLYRVTGDVVTFLQTYLFERE